MKIAFITESPYVGKYPRNFTNARTEIAWQIELGSKHYPIHQYDSVFNYDLVFVIIPKGTLTLNAVGSTLIDTVNPITSLLSNQFISTLKSNNKKVYVIQEGPAWLFNDWEIIDQFNYYNNIVDSDGLLVHNMIDKLFYSGIFPDTLRVEVIPTLMIEDSIKDIIIQQSNKVIIGGNFSRWYGGFQSYIVSDEFKCEKWTQDSHSKRTNEDSIDDLNHLPRLSWTEWMKTLSSFKYAVHLMPTVAAGTFSLNCAYFGIPCIGNEKMDTQRICFPKLSVDVDDIYAAKKLAHRLSRDEDFYKECSMTAKLAYRHNYDIEVWRNQFWYNLKDK